MQYYGVCACPSGCWRELFCCYAVSRKAGGTFPVLCLTLDLAMRKHNSLSSSTPATTDARMTDCFCVADAAACVAASSLKHMLNSQDALLGPWLPGRDMLEDELRTFVGKQHSCLFLDLKWSDACYQNLQATHSACCLQQPPVPCSGGLLAFKSSGRHQCRDKLKHTVLRWQTAHQMKAPHLLA